MYPEKEDINTGEDTFEEYVHMTLPNGESVRFKREWSGYRFTDDEVSLLTAGYALRIRTKTTDGIVGSLDWQEYKGQMFYGFASWDAEAYTKEDAPFPVQWNGYIFTDDEKTALRSGERLLLLCTSAQGMSPYSVHVSYDLIPKTESYEARWGIIPHFEEFNRSAVEFTRETCIFRPLFGGRALSQDEIRSVRRGESIPFVGMSKHGNPYTCDLTLELDTTEMRWRLVPQFHIIW